MYFVHIYWKYSVAARLGIMYLSEWYRISSPHGKCWCLKSGSTSADIQTPSCSFAYSETYKDRTHDTHLHSVSLPGPGWERGTLCGPLASAASVPLAASPGPPLHPASSCLHTPWRPSGGPAFLAARSRPRLGPLPWESRSARVRGRALWSCPRQPVGLSHTLHKPMYF